MTSRGPELHSRKPEGVQDWLERILPGPYLELFARRARQTYCEMARHRLYDEAPLFLGGPIQ